MRVRARVRLGCRKPNPNFNPDPDPQPEPTFAASYRQLLTAERRQVLNLSDAHRALALNLARP